MARIKVYTLLPRPSRITRLRVVLADNGCQHEPSTGLDPTPGALEAWRIVIVGIAGERGLYHLLVPGEGAQVKVEGEAMGSPAVGKSAWRKLQEVYGRISAEEKPQQLLRQSSV